MPNRKQHRVGKGMKDSSTELGKFLQARRLTLQLNQVDVCKQLGLHQGVYSLLELGKRKKIEKEQLQKLSEILKCSLLELEEKLPKRKCPETELGKFICKVFYSSIR